MKDVAIPLFPRASLPLKGQRAQSGEPPISRNSLLSYLVLVVVLLPWSVVAVEEETGKLLEKAPVAPSLDGTLSQSAVQHTSRRIGGQPLLRAESNQDRTLSSTTFSVTTLPGGLLTHTMPVHDGTSTFPHATPHYGTLGAASLPPALFASYGAWPGSKVEHRGEHKMTSAPDIQEAVAGHDVNDTGAVSIPAMTDLPAALTFSRSPDAKKRARDSRRFSSLTASMPTLGKNEEDKVNPSDIRYSLTPMLRTLHIDSLHPHVSPALCWANDKYGRASKPWYCSLICRLMARKVAEKEAAKYRNWKNTLLSSSLNSPSSTGEWLDSKEFHRLAKAVLDASTRSPVVVFTKGHCRYCKDAIKLLQGLGVKQIYVVDLGRAPDMLKIQLVLEKLTGARTVPRIYIGGVCIGGLSDMTKEHENGTLKQRLKRASAL